MRGIVLLFVASCAAGPSATDGQPSAEADARAPVCAPQAAIAEAVPDVGCETMFPSDQPVHCGSGPDCCFVQGGQGAEQTCVDTFEQGPPQEGCGFYYPSDDARYAVLCGAGAMSYPNFCPAGTACIEQTFAPGAAVHYGCCPTGETCEGVTGFGVCAE